MGVYTTPAQASDFISALKDMYNGNEYTGNPYQFSWAQNANSGYSFGQMQWDLLHNGDAATWLSNLTGADGNPVFNASDIAKLTADPKVAPIDPATLQDYSGRLQSVSDQIDNYYTQGLNHDVDLINGIVDELRASGDPAQNQVADFISNNIFAQLLLADYDNQYHIDGVDGVTGGPDGKLMQYLKNSDGNFGLVDLFDYLLSTDYALTDRGNADINRRIDHTLDVALRYGQGDIEGVFSWVNVHGVVVGVNSAFLAARSWVRRDPLTRDLNGDGLKTLAIDPNSPILFDHDGDGIKTGGSWISAQDGFLVLDRNGNGTIDSGTELFGDSTILSNGQKATDGFAALADLDANHDGVFDANDAQFANVRVWVDANSNAISDAGEIKTLSQLNIQSIALAKTATNQTLPDGSRVADTGTFTYTDGTVGQDGVAGDVDLREAA